MNKVLYIILIFLITLAIFSCAKDEPFYSDPFKDTTAPVIEEVTFVTTPTNDSTPDYTFSSDEAGIITYGGSCSSGTTSTTTDNNTITLNTLSDGTHSNCTIIVTDSAGNASSALSVSTFVVDTTAPSVSSFTLSDTALKVSDTATVTLRFSEAVVSFSSSADITADNGTLAAMSSADNITWTGTFTPTANTEDDNNTLSLATSYTDTAGNTGPAATTLNYVIETTAPTVSSISPTDNQSSVSITDNITVTFTEAMEPSYVTTTTSDYTCRNETIKVSSDNFSTCVRMSSEPVSSNSNMTFTLDPYDNLSITTYKIRVTTGVKDSAGNTLSSQYETSNGFATSSSSSSSGSGVFVGVDYYGNVVRSTDNGSSWDNATTDDPTEHILRGVTFGNNTFVAVGQWGYIVRSTDNGSSWDNATTDYSTDNYHYGVTFGNDTFVAVGSSGNKVIRSTDNGSSWDNATTDDSTGNKLYGVTFGNNTFVAVGLSGNIVRSTDNGLTWDNATIDNSTANQLMGVTFGNNTFVAVGYSGNIVRSTDNGSSWDNATTDNSTANNLIGVTFGNNTFVGVGASGNIVRSTDNGLNWDNATTDNSTATPLDDVTFGNNTFVGVGD